MSLAHALALYGLGFSIFRVPRPRAGVPAGQPGDGKVPAMAWKPYQTERAPEADIRTWFSEPQNIAIVTGSISGIVVVDADSTEALRWCAANLTSTPWQTKTLRGFHLFYRYPDTAVGNRARLETRNGRIAVDVRGEGGYVIGPGSLHASGAWYSAEGNWSIPREQVPVFWPGWLERPRRPHIERNDVRTTVPAAVTERARRYLAAIPRPEIGSGSDAATLNAACRLVRGFELCDAEAIDLLLAWAGGRPGWSREWIAEKVQNAHRYGSEPVGALR